MDEHEVENYKRILNWFKGKKQPPFKIDIELHRRCNSRCLSCSRRASPDYEKLNEISKQIEMPLEKWIEIIEEAAELGVKEWHLAGGGEPMFLPEVTIPVMKEIKKFEMLGIITTNGTLWKKELIEKTVKMGWDRVHFSIDGPNPRIHDYLRGIPGSFKKVIKTIEKFNEFKKKYNTGKPMLNINMVLSRKNYKFLPDMVNLAKNLGVEFLFVDPLIVYSKFGEKLKMKKEDLEKFPPFLKKARELAGKFEIGNNFSGLQNNLNQELIEKSSKMDEVVEKDVEKVKKLKLNRFLKNFLVVPCYKPWFHMTVKCDGRVTSCDVPVTGGDEIRNKTLKEVWFGEYFNWLRKCLLSGKIPNFCSQCNASHVSQRRMMRLEIIKMLEPEAFKEACKIYGAL
ncbi:MAG: radical SAM protein [Candidatus Aenigmatarchaeota archaeon]